MNISIYTPTHNTVHLRDLYDSIKDQNFFEWVIVPNNMDELELNDVYNLLNYDNRIKIYPYEGPNSTWVGALKKYAISKCLGDVYLEVDHDDLLTEFAIERVDQIFTHRPEIGFVYSNTVEFREADGGMIPNNEYPSAAGFQYRDFEYKGFHLKEMLSFPPNHISISQIWYAPNHLRAWRKETYLATGGYNENMRVLDDLDLMCKTYLVTKMYLLNEPLYLYRITGKNTWLNPELNNEIQINVPRIFDMYIREIAGKWSDENGLLKLDLGGRFNAYPNYISVDLKDAEVITDLNRPWPFEDNSVGVIIANDILEHLADKIHTIKEIYRVLAHGGLLLVQVPSTDGRGAFQDPTHVAYYNENSFWYYIDSNLAKYINTPVTFQKIFLSTDFPTDWHRQNNISYVKAQLLALKDEKGIRYPGLINI
jgi:SAM-dependent methyltransferase